MSELAKKLYGEVKYSDLYNDAALNDEWAIPSLMLPIANKLAKVRPFINDIWQGKGLIFHKPFNSMTNEEFLNYKALGEDYYQKFLQNNPINIKNYGEITFSRHNKGKDKTVNYEQYPFLRMNLYNAKKEDFSTNYKNEEDRMYDYFTNKYKGDLFNYLIENIDNRGFKYKMMKNKSKGN